MPIGERWRPCQAQSQILLRRRHGCRRIPLTSDVRQQALPPPKRARAGKLAGGLYYGEGLETSRSRDDAVSLGLSHSRPSEHVTDIDSGHTLVYDRE